MTSLGASKLGGQEIKKLTKLIASAFDDDGLEQLVRTEMDVGLYDDLVAPNQKRTTLVFKLLEAVEQRGTMAKFLKAVLEARPDRPDLREFILNCDPEVLQGSQSQAKETRGAPANIQVSVKDGGIQGVGAAQNVHIGTMSFGSPPKRERE
jgi:Effector-associated domain 1